VDNAPADLWRAAARRIGTHSTQGRPARSWVVLGVLALAVFLIA